MRVPVYERQVGIGPMPGARVSAAGGAEAYGAPVGAAIHELGGRAYQIAQDVEDAKTLSLFNAFRKESQQYHEDPDKGVYQTRILGGAQGVTADADKWLEGKITEYDRKMPSSRAANNFRRMAEQYRQQRGDQNSRFEAGELKKYREGEADAAIKLRLNDIAQNYDDDEAVERAKQGMTEALELRTRGMSPEAKRAALAEMDNQAASVRLSRMLEEDPQKAAEWFREHQKEFTADGVVRAEKAVNNAVETYEVQALAGALFNKYGPDGEKAALQDVRDNYGGEKENRLAAMVKTLYQEHDIDTAKEQRLKALHQKEQEDALFRMWLQDGKLSPELLEQMALSGKISPSGYSSLNGLAESQATRAKIEKRLLSANPNMTQGDLDAAVMRQMGITNEEYQKTFAAAARGVMDGTMSEKELDFLHQRGRLTTSDVVRLKKRGKDVDDLQKHYLNGQRSDMTDMLRDYIKSYGTIVNIVDTN